MYYAKWIYHYVYQWQTLITGILALAGALITVHYLRHQTRKSEELAKQANDRDDVAARAVLSLHLSDLSEYARSCIQLIEKHLDRTTSLPADTEVAAPPPDAILALQACVRYSAPAVSEQISLLLNKLQVQRSRFSGFIEKYRGSYIPQFEAVDRIIELADLYAEVDRLYLYSRNEDGMRERRPPSELLNAIGVCGIHGDNHPVRTRLSKMAS